MMQGKYDEAKSYYTQLLEISDIESEDTDVALFYNGLSLLYFNQSRDAL